MAAFAYLFLPVSGLLAYLTGREPRVRFHGLQAIVLGLLWPVALYAASIGPSVIVQIVFVVGALAWAGFLIATFIGRDPRLPGVAQHLETLATTSFRDVPRNTSDS